MKDLDISEINPPKLKERRVFKGHSSKIASLAWSKDSKQILTAGQDRMLIVSVVILLGLLKSCWSLIVLFDDTLFWNSLFHTNIIIMCLFVKKLKLVKLDDELPLNHGSLLVNETPPINQTPLLPLPTPTPPPLHGCCEYLVVGCHDHL